MSYDSITDPNASPTPSFLVFRRGKLHGPQSVSSSRAVHLPRCLHLRTFDTGSTFISEGDSGLQWSSSKQAAFTGSQLRLLYWWFTEVLYWFISEGQPHTAESPAASGHLLLVCSGLSLPMVLEDSIPQAMGDLRVID